MTVRGGANEQIIRRVLQNARGGFYLGIHCIGYMGPIMWYNTLTKRAFLSQRGIGNRTMVFSGAESDVCFSVPQDFFFLSTTLLLVNLILLLSVHNRSLKSVA